jgi:uncharacterized protein (TIGR03067 family)
MSRRLLALVTLLGASDLLPSAPLPFPPRNGSKADLRAIQGEWEAASYTLWHGRRGDTPVREEVHGLRVWIEERRIGFTSGDDTRWYLFRLNGSAGQRRIDSDPVTGDFNRPSDGREGDRWKRPGIYRLKGDTLTICDGPEGKRPEDFTGGGAGERLIILRRAKPRP